MTELVLETRDQENRTTVIGPVMLTPSPGQNYWSYRVALTPSQAIVGFPKFATVGIGFAREDEDWNTNLPYTCDAKQIFEHISHNKGDDSISDEDCVAAIEMIRAAIYAAPEHAARMAEMGRPVDWEQEPIVFEAVDLDGDEGDGEPTAGVTNPDTVVSLHVIADRPSFGAGGRCPECGAELVPNNCTSGVCPGASCHNCGYGCDLFTDGAGKCVMALKAKSPLAGGEQ